MFRKMAIVLMAASVFTAPALAQNNTLTGGTGSKNPAGPSAPASDGAEKADKAEKAEKPAKPGAAAAKAGARHHRVARYHRHRTTATLGKARSSTIAVSGKHPSTRTAKFAKEESRRMVHGRTPGRHAYGSEMTQPGKFPPHRAGHAYGRAPKRPLSKPGVH
jgi:hypothetical protein